MPSPNFLNLVSLPSLCRLGRMTKTKQAFDPSIDLDQASTPVIGTPTVPPVHDLIDNPLESNPMVGENSEEELVVEPTVVFLVLKAGPRRYCTRNEQLCVQEVCNSSNLLQTSRKNVRILKRPSLPLNGLCTLNRIVIQK